VKPDSGVGCGITIRVSDLLAHQCIRRIRRMPVVLRDARLSIGAVLVFVPMKCYAGKLLTIVEPELFFDAGAIGLNRF
jgi:hypothetical protein